MEEIGRKELKEYKRQSFFAGDGEDGGKESVTQAVFNQYISALTGTPSTGSYVTRVD